MKYGGFAVLVLGACLWLAAGTARAEDAVTFQFNPPDAFSPTLMPVTSSYTFDKMARIAGHPCAMLKNVITPDLKAAGQDLKKLFDLLQLIPKEMKSTFSVQA